MIVIMTIWSPDLTACPGPAYLAIATAIGEAVAAGELAAGDRLPPQRDLAYRLGLSLNTVTRAYAEAVRRGFVEGEVRRGTYVRHAGPLPGGASAAVPAASLRRPADGPIDFANNLPFPGGAAAALARTLGDLSRLPGLGAFLDHQPESVSDRHEDAARGSGATSTPDRTSRAADGSGEQCSQPGPLSVGTGSDCAFALPPAHGL